MEGRMIRKQTYINLEQDLALKRHAQKQSVTEAEVIRRAIDAYLGEEIKGHNPLLDLIGIGKGASDLEDGSIKHDKYIYERS